METKGPNTCINHSTSQDRSNLDSSHITVIIIDLIAVNSAISEKVLEAVIVKEVGYVTTRKKIRDGKKIATMKIYGSWEQSYQELPHLMNVLQTINPGTCVDSYFKEHDLGGHILEVLS